MCDFTQSLAAYVFLQLCIEHNRAPAISQVQIIRGVRENAAGALRVKAAAKFGLPRSFSHAGATGCDGASPPMTEADPARGSTFSSARWRLRETRGICPSPTATSSACQRGRREPELGTDRPYYRMLERALSGNLLRIPDTPALTDHRTTPLH